MEQRKGQRKCARCDGTVQGAFRGVKLSVCCAECCEKARREVGFYCVSWREALYRFQCRVKDLKAMVCKNPENPCCRCYRNHFYLLAEVQQLGRLRRAEKKGDQSLRNKKQKQTLARRRQNLLKSLNVTLDDFSDENNRTLMIFLVGDYFQRWRSQMKLKDIKKRWKALPRVREILCSCPDAHPGAVFDFCVSHPDAGPVEFQELKSKIRSVFYAEGRKILGHLNHTERLALVNTPLKEEFMDFHSDDVRSIIRGHLLQYVSPALAYDIMNQSNLQERAICEGESKLHDSKELCLSLKERREQLEKELVNRGLSPLLWSNRCQMYL